MESLEIFLLQKMWKVVLKPITNHSIIWVIMKAMPSAAGACPFGAATSLKGLGSVPFFTLLLGAGPAGSLNLASVVMITRESLFD